MFKNLIYLSVFLAVFTSFGKTRAQESPEFAFPLDCALGETCWIANYVDVDPAEDTHKDFKCNAKTYEGHQGTDFALRSRAEMKDGVNVLAARDGKVLRFRDGEDDRPKTTAERKAITQANKDCGNGVILDHGNGLLTYYCHLKSGSIKVGAEEEIEEGDVIAQVGQSGNAEFPHLHLTVIWEGGHIDPFTGHLKEEGCGKFKRDLWKGDLTYAPYAVYDGGFSGNVPNFKVIENGQKAPKTISPASEAFVFWSSFYQVQEGDEITLTIKDPEGKVFAQRSLAQDKNRARQHYYTGRSLRDRTLESGVYTGITTIKRPGQEPETHKYNISVE